VSVMWLTSGRREGEASQISEAEKKRGCYKDANVFTMGHQTGVQVFYEALAGSHPSQ
jgi:hypothetical protein